MLAPGKKAMTNLNRVLKSRDITLSTSVYIVKVMVFPVVMYRCEKERKESWTLNNWCFQTVVLEKILESPWTSRRSNSSILKYINPEYSSERLMLKVKLQYFGHLIQRADSLDKTLMLWKTECKRRREQQRMRWLEGITDSMEWIWANPGESGGQRSLVCYSPWGHKEWGTT